MYQIFIYNAEQTYEEFEDTKGVIRIRKLKDRQDNGQKGKQRYTKHTYQNKDRVT
jgi:hypothetical protein